MKKQTVTLTYFKASGKYYARERFETEQQLEYKVIQDVKLMQAEGELPSLSLGRGSDFYIHISYGEGPMFMPHIIKPLEQS